MSGWKSYVDVLEQKALRLKQLMEDLTEVSRISSGNISLQMANIDLAELVRQTGGEFNEKLEQKELNVISKFPREPAVIFADGRQLWRVIGNLYSNAAKYALPRSRVYVEVEKQDGKAIFFHEEYYGSAADGESGGTDGTVCARR